MSLKLFLTPPEFLDHYPVLFLNVTIDPTADASGLNPGTLSHGAKDFQCFLCFFGRKPSFRTHLRGRSMLEIMQVASKEVQVPQADIDRGVATANRTDNLGSATDEPEWFVVKSSDSEPKDSSLSIEYRGHWFYIEDTDLQSRETFAMLTALFAVVGGTVPGAHPVLTLPVGR